MITKLLLIQTRVLFLLLLSLPIAVRAQFTWTNINGALTITGYSGPGGAVTIPATIDGLPVTAVGGIGFSTVFAGNPSVTSIIVPHGVRTIGMDAFADCPSLASVVVSDTVTNIGGNAFGLCPSLTAITVAGQNPVYSSVGGVLFNKRQTTLIFFPGGQAGSYAIPGTVTSIGTATFQWSVLTNITIPDSVVNIGTAAFDACTNLQSVTIPRRVASIGIGVFTGCSRLRAITVEAGNAVYSSVDGILFDKRQTTVLQCPGALAGGVTLPNTVTNIENGAFAQCTGLTGITLAARLTTLEFSAFSGCTSLTSVVIPNRVTSISDGAFENCTGLTNVILGNNVTNIGQFAFASCSSLPAITLPDDLAIIDIEAFQNCFDLTSVTIPHRVKTIGNNAFSGTGLTNIAIGSGVTNLGSYAFANCLRLTNVAIPGSVIRIGPGVFAECSALTNVTIGNGVRFIGDSAFSEAGLGNVTIPASVTNIGICPFGGVPVPEVGPNLLSGQVLSPEQIDVLAEAERERQLQQSPILPPANPPVLLPPTQIFTPTVALPVAVGAPAGAGVLAAPNSPLLTTITVDPGNPAYASVNGVLFNKNLTALIEYPDGLAGNYTIPNSVVSIGTNAFETCSYLTNVMIPIGVTSIGDTAFENCYNLASIIVPDSVTNLGYELFYECSSLTNAIIGNGVTMLGNEVFQSCYNLAGITIGTNVNTIGDDAFIDCESLTNLTIPASVRTIGANAFSGNMTSITIPAGVTNIGSQVFYDCFELTAITVAPGNPAYSSVAGVLFDKPQATLIQFPAAKTGAYVIPNSVTNIAAWAFAFCRGLTNVIFPEGITSIGAEAFWGCDGLTEVTIPSSVASLGDGAFFDCNSLTNVYFQGNAPAADASAYELPFDSDEEATVYYAPGTSGWGSTFGGVPTAPQNSPTGSLQVQITPSLFTYEPGLQSDFEPDWQVDGGMSRYGDATVSSLSVGSHTVTFTANTGWSTPASQTVTIIAGQTTSIAATYLDDTWPTNQITRPVPNQRVSNTVVTVTGTASAPLGVAGVWYQLNNGAWTLATTTNNWANWSANVFPAPGTNILRSYAVDANDRQILYVGDRLNSLIRKITPADQANSFVDGQVVTLAGDTYDLTNHGGAGTNVGYADGVGEQAHFNNPNGTAVDSAGNIYVADTGNNLIRKITPAGLVTTLAGDIYDLTNGGYTAAEFVQPNAGFADGLGSAAQFDYPCGIAVDGSGNVYVADVNNNLIRKITPAGMVTTLAGDTNSSDVGFADGQGGNAQFDAPYGVAVDGAGNVIVADTYNNVIRKVTPEGVVTTLAGDTDDLTNFVGSSNRGYADGPAGAARFSLPFGVTVDATGNIIVSDSDNNLVRQISVAGQVTTLAGDTYDVTNDFYRNDAGAGFADGIGSQVRFNEPGAVATDIYGNVYVDDCNNNVIRQIAPNGQTTTLAGTFNYFQPTNGGYADGYSWAAQFHFATPSGLAVDGGGGNYSLTNTVVFNYIPSAILPLQVVGGGTISPDYDNVPLAVGEQYTLTVRAAPGFVFTNWMQWNVFTTITTNYDAQGQPVLPPITSIISSPGAVLTSNPVLHFTMQAPAVIFSEQSSSITEQTGYLATFVDVQKPVVTIESPTVNEFVTNSDFLIYGTASDNAAVASVWYQFNGGGWLNPSGITNWSVPVTLNPGPNTISAYAVDTSGNVSLTNTVNFLYVSKATLSVFISGNGAISPNYNGTSLQIGQNYSMTARPGVGFAFSNWEELGMSVKIQTSLGSAGPISTITTLVTNIYSIGVVTNGPTLKFEMVAPVMSNSGEPYFAKIFTPIGYQANFVDIAPPAVTVTAPSPNQHVSNIVYTVTGTARDNAGVAAVYYQLNGAGWQPASTGNGYTNWFTPGLDLIPSAPNTLQVYAVDTSGNISATDTVYFVNRQVDLAPVSLAGSVADGTPVHGFPFSFGFGTNTFNLFRPGAVLNTPNSSVGEYTYTKLSVNEGLLAGTNTAPPSAAGGPFVLDLNFTAPNAGTYSNEDTGEAGTISFHQVPTVVPGSIGGENLLLFQNGVESSMAFGSGSPTVTTSSGEFASDPYSFEPYSPLAGLITVGNANQGTNYLILVYANTNWGQYYSTAFDAAGNARQPAGGTFVFPTSPAAAPASLAGTWVDVIYGNGAPAEVGFGASTYSQYSWDTNHAASVGDYKFRKLNATNVLLTLEVAAPPDSADESGPLLLEFLAPNFCVFTNRNDPANTLGTAGFAPIMNLTPKSLAGLTVYATNATDGSILAITCGERGTFTQVESNSSSAGTGRGTYTYTAYDPVGGLLKLQYTSPAVLAGATYYWQPTFFTGEFGAFNSTFYDKAGDAPVTGGGSFSVH
jgi:hypothetical protein